MRIERLQSISEADAVAEGVGRIGADFPNSDWSGGPNFWTVDLPTKGVGFSANSPTAAGAFRMLWEHIHGEEAWDANPFVVALTFAVERRNIDAAPQPAKAVPDLANTEEPIWF